MSTSLATPELLEGSYARIGVPIVPPWVLPRTRLNRLLDNGTTGALTVVSAPTGTGKTLGVASWVAASSGRGVVWLNLARGGAGADRVWRLLRRGLQGAGETLLPAVPAGRALAPARVNALVELGEALRDREPWIVVLDGFPAGSPTQLASELEILLDHAGGALRVVLICQTEPALDVHRFAAAGELVRVTDADLVMDDVEIAGVLRLANAAIGRGAVAAVAEHTTGWACGVRHAAVNLAGEMDLASALEETDGDIEDYLTREVLAVMDPPVRRLLVLTSVVELVSPEVARAVLGPGSSRAIDRAAATTGLVRRLSNGSVTCHPLLRAAARAQLAGEQSARARVPRERVVRWFADNGAIDAAVELGVVAQRWADVAEVLLQANVVPQLMAGTADERLRRAAERPEVQAAEPLICAAVALARADVLGAESALATSAASEEDSSSAHAVGVAFVKLGIGRLSRSPVSDAGLAQRTRRLLAQALPSAPDEVAELSVVLDAYSGAVDVPAGHLEQAAVTLARGADHRPIAGRSSSADCAGQLALLEAYRGNLDEATRRAKSAVSIAAHDREPGVAHAHVAMAWVHIERGELPEAETWLARAACSLSDVREPWPHLARQLVRARVLIASGRADEALRRAATWWPSLDECDSSDWLAAQVTTVSAEALLASGEPQQALALVTSGMAGGSAERAVLTALARRDIGDLRGAGASILSAADDLRSAPRATQLQGWLLEARLAHERGQLDRTVLLVDRSLRAASAEQLRRPLAESAAWLRWFLDRDGTTLRDHRPFVATLEAVVPGASRASASTPTSTHVLEPLTERETQVLELLAQMCSTDEIAAELFVSANTVKTHLKGIFRKYGVNRRVDAVRRGRELGLC